MLRAGPAWAERLPLFLFDTAARVTTMQPPHPDAPVFREVPTSIYAKLLFKKFIYSPTDGDIDDDELDIPPMYDVETPTAIKQRLDASETGSEDALTDGGGAAAASAATSRRAAAPARRPDGSSRDDRNATAAPATTARTSATGVELSGVETAARSSAITDDDEEDEEDDDLELPEMREVATPTAVAKRLGRPSSPLADGGVRARASKTKR